MIKLNMGKPGVEFASHCSNLKMHLIVCHIITTCCFFPPDISVFNSNGDKDID